MHNVQNRPVPVKSAPALSPALIESLVSLRTGLLGNEALALSLGDRLAPLPPSEAVEQAQALQKLAEEHAARLRAHIDTLLCAAGLLAA